jgi:chaperonin cofactor prefoldin
MNRIVMFVLVLLVGTSSYLNGQSRTSSDRDRDRDPGPITTLISLRQELSLSAGQVAQLESIRSQTEQQNQPLVTRMSEIRRRLRSLGEVNTDRERELRQQWMAEARPIMRTIDQNNRAAMEQVGDILTQVQRDEIARRLRERDENNDRERSSSTSQRSNRN